MSAAALTSSGVEIKFSAIQPSSNPLVSGKRSPSISNKTDYTSGTAATAADRCYLAQLTLTAGETRVIDLNAGAIADVNGDAITFARLRAIYVEHDAASLNTSTVLIDGRASVSGTITGATNASPIVVTSAAHPLNTGDSVTIASVGGNTAANGTFTVTRVSASTFSLDGSTGNSAYTSGGTWTQTRGPIGDLTATLAAGEAAAINRPKGNGMVLTNSTADKIYLTSGDGTHTSLVNLMLLGGSA